MSSYADLRRQADETWRRIAANATTHISVGLGSCGVAAGAQDTLDALRQETAKLNLEVHIGITGCLGTCFAEPVVNLRRPGQAPVAFGPLPADAVADWLQKVLVDGELPGDNLLGSLSPEGSADAPPISEHPFFQHQERRLMANCGLIDPEDIDHYLANDGYAGLANAIAAKSGEQIDQELIDAGVSGRAGAYFPTGRKWEFLRTAQAEPKYMICNADEGDPGAFVNRTLLESDPHLVIEGILIGAFATGATTGFIYLRNEYPLAHERLATAIAQAEERDLIGDNILDSDFNCEVILVRGAGSYVCGEETGLISSIQDSRGMPRIRPPYPAASGVFFKPTNVNNVESFANAPLVMRHGAPWYREMGTEANPGTKMFSLSGDINRVGVVEVPLGTVLRGVIEDCGGGVPHGRSLKAIQPGGPLAGIMPADLLDTPLEPAPFRDNGVLLGGGGLVAIDEGACMVDLAKFFSEFAEEESCARCNTCRNGSMRLVDALERIVEGHGLPEDLETVELLASWMSNANCAHGQATPTAALTALRFWREEFEQHVNDNTCATGVCEGLAQR